MMVQMPSNELEVISGQDVVVVRTAAETSALFIPLIQSLSSIILTGGFRRRRVHERTAHRHCQCDMRK